MTDTASLEVLNITNPVSTPDDNVRVQEFEDRMKFAIQQSLKLQQMQLNQIDNLQKEYEVCFFVCFRTMLVSSKDFLVPSTNLWSWIKSYFILSLPMTRSEGDNTEQFSGVFTPLNYDFWSQETNFCRIGLV